MKLNLLVISLNGDPLEDLGTVHAGGQCKYVFELGKNLIRNGWDIDVLTIGKPTKSKIENITEGFTVIRIDLPNQRPYSHNVNAQDILLLSNNAIKELRERNRTYNVILACYWLSGVMAIILKQELNIKALLTYCSIGVFKQKAVANMDLSERIQWEKKIGHQIDHIIATNREEKKALIANYDIDPIKITIIPRGIDLSLFYGK